MKSITESINHLDKSFLNLNFFENSLALRYQECSKYDKFSFLRERGNILMFNSPYMIRLASHPYKSYPNAKSIKLNGIRSTGLKSRLLRVIEKRRTNRKFTKYTISINEIYTLLHYSYGITGKASVKGGEGTWFYRAVPSGGALYPLEMYLFMNDSIIQSGMYHYRPDDETIELISDEVKMDDIKRCLSVSNINISQCSCLVFITSMFQRQMIKYGERGYRFILQEVGAVIQNLSLVSEEMDLSSCVIGGYLDDEINKCLGIDTPMETIQGVVVIGKS